MSSTCDRIRNRLTWDSQTEQITKNAIKYTIILTHLSSMRSASGVSLASTSSFLIGSIRIVATMGNTASLKPLRRWSWKKSRSSAIFLSREKLTWKSRQASKNFHEPITDDHGQLRKCYGDPTKSTRSTYTCLRWLSVPIEITLFK